MKTPALGEVAKVVSGATPKTGVPEYWGGDVQWATPADLSKLDGAYISSTSRTLTDSGVRSCATRVLPEGSVLLSSRAPIGHVAINTVPMATNQGFKSIVPSHGLDAKYLYYWLRSQTNYLQGLGNGATFKELSKRTAEQIEIPLPSLDEQRRIAAILDHAEALRAKRRQLLVYLGDLAESVFRDMFGDLRQGAWERVPFADLVKRVENGRSPNCESRAAGSDEWGVLKLGAVTYGEFRAAENKAFLGEVGGMAANEVRSGDVLMTRKNTRELVGAVSLVGDVRPRLLLPDLIFRLHLDAERLDRRYFQALMMNRQKRPAVRNLSSGSASSMPNISKARLAKLPLELPPLILQQDFASRVEAIDELRRRVESGSTADNELFASLQSRAFRGEL